MSSVILTKGDESICVVKLTKNPEYNSFYLIYKLEGTEEYGFQFYGVARRFELPLSKTLPLSNHPYGLLGSRADLSGRMLGAIAQRMPLVSGSGKEVITFERPIYSLIGEYPETQVSKVLDKFITLGFVVSSLEQRDFPYACLSTSSTGVGDAGDDLYLNTLFFMTKGYGILTKISAVAGRGFEDCCSPEFHYEAHKVKLDEANPLKRIHARDMVPEAVPANWTVSVSPEITDTVEVKSNDNSNKICELDKLIDELFETLVPEVNIFLNPKRNIYIKNILYQ